MDDSDFLPPLYEALFILYGGRLSVVSIYEVNMVSSSQVMDIDDDMRSSETMLVAASWFGRGQSAYLPTVG